MNKTILLILMCASYFGFSQTYVSTTTFGTADIDTNYASAKDSQGNVYTVGFYFGTLTVGATTVTSTGSSQEGYLTKHDPDGNPVWIKSFGGNAADLATSITIDANDNIILIGNFTGSGTNSFDADPGPNVYYLSQPASIGSRDGFIVKLDSNGDFLWAKQISNPDGGVVNEDPKGVTTDAAGNVYVVGNYKYADFDPGAGTTILTAVGNNNGFLLKLASNGDFVWVKTFDSSNNSYVNSIALDASENIYLVGRYDGAGNLDMDPSSGVQMAPASVGSYDIFFVKLTNSGDFAWAKTFGGSGLDDSKFVQIINSEAYILGNVSGTTDLDPGASVNSITCLGTTDGFMSKFDLNGNYLYSYVIGGNATDVEEMYRIKEGPNGNLFISGLAAGTADADYGTGTSNIVSFGKNDVYVVEITSAGNYVTHATFGGTLAEAFPKVEFNNQNYMFIIGSFNSAVIDFDPFAGTTNINNTSSSGTYDVYFTKLEWLNIPLSSDSFAEKTTSVFPNPVLNNLYISNVEDYNFYEVFNALGQKVVVGKVQETISFDSLPKGLYVLNLIGEKGKSTHKIIKE